MRQRSSFILLLFTAVLWVVFAGDCIQPHHANLSSPTAAHGATMKVGFALSQAECTLPQSIEKTQQLVVTHISARQLLKRLSETVFGHAAKCYTTRSVSRLVVSSHTIILNFETYDIGFPFSVFW